MMKVFFENELMAALGLKFKNSASHLFIHLIIFIVQNYNCNVHYVIYLLFGLLYLIIITLLCLIIIMLLCLIFIMLLCLIIIMS